MLFYDDDNHFSKSLYCYSHEKESENSDDEVSACFSEFFDEISSEHDGKCGRDRSRKYCDNAIHSPIAMHRYDVGHPRCWEGERECERDNESFIQVLMDEMVTFDFIDLRTICFFSLHHRKCDKKEDDGSGDAKILGFESKKCEEILPDHKGSEHRNKENETESFPIFSVLFRTGIRMEFCVEW